MTQPPPQSSSHQDKFSDSISATSAASTPRSNHHHNDPCLRFMCSFGGKILPRPHDNQLRYVGGDTRIIAISRHATFSALLSKLSKTVGTVAINNLTVKYQLPNEDLDALISVSTDEDVENMMDEYDRVGSKTGRLRLFLFDELSRTSSISSILTGSMRRESWFLDALNGGGVSTRLERGASEASSIVSEIPDYLFGLDADEPNKIRTRSNLADSVSYSDPGSPAPVISSSSSFVPSFVASSASATAVIAPQMVQNLPLVRTRVETVMIDPPVSTPTGLFQGNNTMWQHNPDPHYAGQNQTAVATSFQPMPVYYIPGPAQPGPMQAQFVQVQPGQQQIPVGYHPVGMGMGQIHGVPSGAMLRPMGVGLNSYESPGPGYYTQPVHMHQAAMVPTALAGLDERTVPGSGSNAMGSGVGQ